MKHDRANIFLTIPSMGRRASRLFTLVEMLAILAITSILISLLLPSLASASRTAKRVACASNMRQIYHGCIQYVDSNRGWLPPTSYNAQYTAYINDYLYEKYDHWNNAKGANGYVYGLGNIKPIGLFYCPALYSRAKESPVWGGSAENTYYLSNYMQSSTWIKPEGNRSGCWSFYLNSTSLCYYRRLGFIKDGSVIVGEADYAGITENYNQCSVLDYISWNRFDWAAAPAWRLHELSANFMHKDGSVRLYIFGDSFDSEYVPKK